MQLVRITEDSGRPDIEDAIRALCVKRDRTSSAKRPAVCDEIDTLVEMWLRAE